MRRVSHAVFRAVLRTALLALVPCLTAFAAEKPDVRGRLIAPAAVAPAANATLVVEMTIGTGWHVNSHTPSESYLIPTSVSLSSSAGKLSDVRYPAAVEKRFSFSDAPLRVYEGAVRFELDLDVPAGASGDPTVTGTLSYQACNDQQCFPPAKIPLSATISLAAKP